MPPSSNAINETIIIIIFYFFFQFKRKIKINGTLGNANNRIDYS